MPPASGRIAPSSAYVSAPKKERSPPAAHTPSASNVLDPDSASTSPGTRKMPEPMTMPMAAKARWGVPSMRASCGDEPAGPAVAGGATVGAADVGTAANMARPVVYRNGTLGAVPVRYDRV